MRHRKCRSAPALRPAYLACGLGQMAQGRITRALASGWKVGGRREPGPLFPPPSPPCPRRAACPYQSPVHCASLALALHGSGNPISPSLPPQAWGAGVFPVWLLSTLLCPLTSATGTARACLLLPARPWPRRRPRMVPAGCSDPHFGQRCVSSCSAASLPLLVSQAFFF